MSFVVPEGIDAYAESHTSPPTELMAARLPKGGGYSAA